MSDTEALIRALSRAYPERPIASIEAWADETARMRRDLEDRNSRMAARARAVQKAMHEGGDPCALWP